MKTVNLSLYDRSVSHQIGILRYSTSAVKSAVGFYNRETVPAILNTVAAHDPVGVHQVSVLLDSVKAIIFNRADSIKTSIDGHVHDLAEHEVDHTVSALNAALPIPTQTGIKARVPFVPPPLPVPLKKHVVPIDPETYLEMETDLTPLSRDITFALILGKPSDDQVYAAVNDRPFEGQVLGDYYNDIPESTFDTVKRTISQGYANGLTTDQIIGQLRGTRAQNYRDGVLQQPRNSIERTVRTALNHTASVARDQVFQNNSDIVDSVRWVSTLDMRTSDICMALDGEVFPVDSGPRPPAHFNCRSTTTPITKSWEDLGYSSVDLTANTRASMDGQVPATETYGTWLGRQSEAVQDDVLGPTRAALFRDGGLTVDKFVDDAGRSLTIDQLRTREASAFSDAGL